MTFIPDFRFIFNDPEKPARGELVLTPPAGS